MATIPSHLKSTVHTLYNQGNSAREISDILGFSSDAVYYFMRKHCITRRSKTETAKIIFAKKPLSYKLKKRLTIRDRELKLIGIMLYWAEGYKTNKSMGIDFANADVAMQIVFIRFLREVCGVSEDRIRVLLYCHQGADIPNLIQFWSKTLSVSPSQFSKPYVSKNAGLEKKRKMPYGLVHIRYADKKLLQQILQWIDECKVDNCVGGRVVNYT